MSDPRAWGIGVRRRVAPHEIPRAVLALIAERDGPGCVHCTLAGITPPPSEPLEIDHKRPISQGGDNQWTNLQLLCRYHNRSRGNRAMNLQRIPTWLAALAQRRQLGAHVATCLAQGKTWAPKSAWLAWRIEVLLRNEATS